MSIQFLRDVENYIKDEILAHFRAMKLPDFEVIMLYPNDMVDPLNQTRMIVLAWETQQGGFVWNTRHTLCVTGSEYTTETIMPIILPWAERVFGVL